MTTSSMRCSTSSVSLLPPRANSLMPLSRYGLWEAEITAPRQLRRAASKATTGRGHDAEAVDDDAFAGQAGDERRLQHGRRQAGVATDDGFRAAEDTAGGATEVEGERGGEVDVGDAADAVGPELHRNVRTRLLDGTIGAAPRSISAS